MNTLLKMAKVAKKYQLFAGVLKKTVGPTVLELSSVNDPVFSSRSYGKRYRCKPEGNTVYSPVDDVHLHNGHYGSKSDKSLIHISIDTVSMAGKGFEQKLLLTKS